FSLRLLAWLLQLQIGDIQFRAADAGASRLAAFGAGQFPIFHREFLAAREALLAPWTPLNFEPQVLQRRSSRQRLKRKSQGIAVDIGKFPDAHTHGGELRVRAAA